MCAVEPVIVARGARPHVQNDQWCYSNTRLIVIYSITHIVLELVLSTPHAEPRGGLRLCTRNCAHANWERS